MNYVCGYLCLRFVDGPEFCQIYPLQTLMNLQYSNNIMAYYPLGISSPLAHDRFSTHARGV